MGFQKWVCRKLWRIVSTIAPKYSNKNKSKFILFTFTAQRPQQGRRPQGQRPKQSEAASQGRGGQTSNNRPQNQLRGQDTSFGVGSASIQSRNNNQPQIDIDIVQYDATIPDEDEDVDVPILLADPFNEAAERPLTLYGAPPRGR